MRKGFAEVFGVLLIGAVLVLSTFLYAEYGARKEINLGMVTELTDTINTFRTNVNATDQALRSTTSTDPGHLHTTSSISGVFKMTNGGLGTSTVPAASDMLIGDGTNYQFSSLPNCGNTTTDKLVYTSTTRTWTCAIDLGGASSTLPVLSFSRVSSTKDFTTSTQDFVVIGTSTANGVASTTMSTGAHRVILNFSGVYTNSVAATARFDFSIDGTRVGAGTQGLWTSDDATDDIGQFRAVSMSYVTDVLSSGDHTFRVLVSRNTGSSTIKGSNPPWIFSATELYN